MNETVRVGFCSFLDATQLDESRLSPHTVRFRCTCVKSSDTSYFFIVTLRPWDAVFVFSVFLYLKLQLPCRSPQPSGYSLTKAGDRLFLESFYGEEHQRGSTPPVKFLSTAHRQGRQFSLTGALRRSSAARRAENEGGEGRETCAQSWFEPAVEESPAAGVRRMRTSPGFFMREH